MMNWSMCGCPEKSIVSAELRTYDCSRRVVGGGLLEERHRDLSWPGAQRHADREALVDLVARCRRIVAGVGDVLVAAERGQVHALAVDADLELMRMLEPAHRAEIRAEQLHLEEVLAVERDVALEHEAADGAERQPLDVPRLRRVLPHAVDLAHRRRLRVANRERADAAGRRQVAFEQHGRDAEDVGDVVESGTRVVRGKQRRRIDLEVEQVADGVGVLGAIEPMDERAAGIRPCTGGGIQTAFEPGDKRLFRLSRRRRHAGRRHHAGPELPDDLLPDLGVLLRTAGVEPLQHELAGTCAAVVAGDTVRGHHLLVRAGRRRRRGRPALPRLAARRLWNTESRRHETQRGSRRKKERPPHPAGDSNAERRMRHLNLRSSVTRLSEATEETEATGSHGGTEERRRSGAESSARDPSSTDRAAGTRRQISLLYIRVAKNFATRFHDGTLGERCRVGSRAPESLWP
jgi:hypothetical protein